MLMVGFLESQGQAELAQTIVRRYAAEQKTDNYSVKNMQYNSKETVNDDQGNL